MADIERRVSLAPASGGAGILRCLIVCLLAALSVPVGADDTATTWLEALETARDTLLRVDDASRPQVAVNQFRQLTRIAPKFTDWLLQDAFDGQLWVDVPAGGRQDIRLAPALVGGKLGDLLTGLDVARWQAMTRRVVAELEQGGNVIPPEFAAGAASGDARTAATLYLCACELRRTMRLKPLLAYTEKGIVFARHFNTGGSHYAYTEALTDAQRERNYRPGSALNLLTFNEEKGDFEISALLEDEDGVIRDVDTARDGGILFSWKQSDREDDYSLYEMKDTQTRDIRKITGAPGHADYEPAYLPNGDILFNSTRCVQIVDCWWTEVSNLYTCSRDGAYLRRLTFDQVHTNYPTVTQDGRILYTRWEYNDRGQIYPQGLFRMLPDGTGQQEFYGNNSWFPTTIVHARNIPGSSKVMAIFTGHHSLQAGKLGILDPSLGRQENLGAQLIAPVRATPAEHIDRYGQEGDLFKYPYPLDAEHFLVSYAPLGWENTAWEQQMNRPAFGLYAMDMTGRRELLYLDTEKGLSVGRMAPLRRNDSPHLRPTNVDYRKDTGIYQIQDIYIGAGLKGVPRGTVKALRVVALDYRAAGIGWNSNKGIAGGALVSTPVAIGKGCWDVKIPLGRAKVYEDGSALFSVAARTPLYFQALDEKGRVIQTMRSWSTLQPGEKYSCVGCHEDKNAAPPADGKPTLAMRAGIQALDAPGEGFSFGKQIQPILDTHCITCHYDNSVDMTLKSRDGKTAFSLLGTISEDTQAKRYWSHAYLNLTQDGPEAGLVRWMSTQSAPPVEAPYSAGSVRSPLMDVLEKGHHNVRLSPQELETFACWIDLGVPFCGDYAEAAAWTGEEQAKYAHYLQKRRDMERVEADNVRDYLESRP